MSVLLLRKPGWKVQAPISVVLGEYAVRQLRQWPSDIALCAWLLGGCLQESESSEIKLDNSVILSCLVFWCCLRR